MLHLTTPVRALLYVPRDLPEPGSETGPYVEELSDRCKELIMASGGKTFILFTSYALLNQIYEKLDDGSLPFPLIRQGDLPTTLMIDKFKEKPSVIFGTNSFLAGCRYTGESTAKCYHHQTTIRCPQRTSNRSSNRRA